MNGADNLILIGINSYGAGLRLADRIGVGPQRGGDFSPTGIIATRAFTARRSAGSFYDPGIGIAIFSRVQAGRGSELAFHRPNRLADHAMQRVT